MAVYKLLNLTATRAWQRERRRRRWSKGEMISTDSRKFLWKWLNWFGLDIILEFWFGHSKCHFFGLKDWHFWQKWPFSVQKKCHFEWPNQNSKTTFIVQTFPKYGPYDFYLVNLSLLGAILAIFQFCGFFGLFLALFSLVNRDRQKMADLLRKMASNQKMQETNRH